MPHLFVYGTLMYDEVSNRVVSGRYRRTHATLPGYRRWKVRGQEYPGIVAESTSSVDGIVWFDVSASDFTRLDGFEGEEYERVEAEAHDRSGRTFSVDVYRIRDSHRHLLDGTEWSIEHFERVGLQRFRDTYDGFDVVGARDP